MTLFHTPLTPSYSHLPLSFTGLFVVDAGNALFLPLCLPLSPSIHQPRRQSSRTRRHRHRSHGALDFHPAIARHRHGGVLGALSVVWVLHRE